MYSDLPKYLDPPKQLDRSFERLIRQSRAKSPFHQELAASYREPYPFINDTCKHKNRDYLPIRDISYSSRSRDSLHLPMQSYRSKSYHGDLSRIAPPIATSYLDGTHRHNIDRSHRSLSRSASNLNSSNSYINLRNNLTRFNSTYVDTYSRHHSHHNHQLPDPQTTPVQTNWRSRFRGRNAYKAYRNHSANRPNDREYSIPRTIQSSTPSGYRADSAIPQYPSYDSFTISSRISKSLSDIRTAHSRIDHDHLQLPLRREESYSSRNFDCHADHELASHILNPDIYLRWLKNKWDIQNSVRHQRQSVVPARSCIEDNVYIPTKRFDGIFYPSRTKCLSHDSLWHASQIPKFAKTIKGNHFLI